MSRLTTRMSIMGRKHDIERGQAHHWKKLLKDYDYQLIEEAVDKLGDLEDIEDELGIDLITFVKLTKAKEIYDIEEDSATTFTYIDFENHLIVCIDDFDEMSERNFEWSYRFKDYGKTWALTKEELEK